MEFTSIIGIDVSKHTLDAVSHESGSYKQFGNNKKGFSQLVKWAKKTGAPVDGERLFCFEHTGLYSLPLSIFLAENNQIFCAVPALEIKRSLGLQRGKSDRIDAKSIARYAYLHRAELTPSPQPSKHLLKLQHLISLRRRLVKQRSGFKAAMSEQKQFLEAKENEVLFQVQQDMISQLNSNISQIESEIKQIITDDEHLNAYYRLIISVKGVGLVLAVHLLVYTQCFTRFKSWRQFACYCGIAPFERQSGISLNTGKHVHHLANKKIKTLLNLSACSAILCDPELKSYYAKRVASGHNKMSTINIIRNKILSRVFAVAKRKTPYVIMGNYAA
ncbi:IS110 family transposase [Caldithrix abyssi]|nr:IS110 family transposase [Caldithrix abyssi]